MKMESARPPPFTPSYESGYPPSPRSYESGYPNNTPPPSAPPKFDDELVKPTNLMKPSAPPLSDLNDEPLVPVMGLQTLQPSAPPMDLEYFQYQLNLIEEETNNLNLALIQSELEYILQEISKLYENECEKQCEKKNDPKTIEVDLIEIMNKIFK